MKTITTKISGLIKKEFTKENLIVLNINIPEIWVLNSPDYNYEIEELIKKQNNYNYFELITL
jgi:hypothetical protein